MSQLETIKEYIDMIFAEWDMGEDISKEDFLQLWIDKHSPLEEQAPPTNLTLGTLKSMKKPELQALCKERGLSDKGVKNMLIDRILGKNVSSKKTTEKKTDDILDKLLKNRPQLNIRRNLFGNYEHVETKFVFNEVSQKVVGKQEEDGKISDLTAEDIELCQEHNFTYDLPENLNV